MPRAPSAGVGCLSAALLGLCLVACGEPAAEEVTAAPAWSPPAAPEAKIPPKVVPSLVFREVTVYARLDLNVSGLGAAWMDVDEDGWEDLILAGMDAAFVLRNNHDGSFYHYMYLPHPDHVGGQIFLADLTGDGRDDIFYAGGPAKDRVGHAAGRRGQTGLIRGARVVFTIAPDGTITNHDSLLPATDPSALSSYFAFGDFDEDGDWDLYECRIGLDTGTGVDGDTTSAPDRYLRRDGPLYVDGTADAGFSTSVPSHVAMSIDLDQDGHVDLLVGSDVAVVRDEVFMSDGKGGFVDRGEDFKMLALTSAMGYDAADVDFDGDLDLYISDDAAAGHRMYLQEADGTFTLATESAGFGSTANMVGWGLGFYDFDNDGDEDLFVVNGESCVWCTGPGGANQLFLNDGTGRFEEVDGGWGTGLDVVENSRVAAFSDYDHDGDVDVLVGNVGKPVTLLRNEIGGGRHWLQLRPKDPVYSPPVGAMIELTAGGRVQRRWVKGTPSFGGANSPYVHFGLGDAETAEDVTIRWPDGTVDAVGDLAADQFVVVEKTTPNRREAPLPEAAPPACDEVCGRIAACGADDSLGFGPGHTCLDHCVQGEIEPYTALCVTIQDCADVPACAPPGGRRR